MIGTQGAFQKSCCVARIVANTLDLVLKLELKIRGLNCKAFYCVVTLEMKTTCTIYSSICGRVYPCWQITASLALILALEVKFHRWPLIGRQLTPFLSGLMATDCSVHELRQMKRGKTQNSWQSFCFPTSLLKMPIGIQRFKLFLASVPHSVCMQGFKGKRSVCWKYWPLHTIKATIFSIMQKISGETVLSVNLLWLSSIWQKLLQEKVHLL